MEVKHTLVGFDYMDADLIAEINRNLTTLYSTPAGTCAGDRNYGLSQGAVGMPTNIAENMLAVEVVEKTDIYEPRAEVLEVRCGSNMDGQTFAQILIGPNEDYDPDEYADDEDDQDSAVDEETDDEED